MKLDTRPQDELSLLLWQSHELGGHINSNNTMPCSICRKVAETNTNPDDPILRTHFHGSDFGACKRKVFLTMTTGQRGSSSNPVFLADGHLHEASILNNLKAGLPIAYRIYPMENKRELNYFVCDYQIVGHTDALLSVNECFPDKEVETYLIECKSVKDYTFKKVKEGEISKEWYGQIQIYMLMLELRRAYLLVKHRETSKLLPAIRIDFDPEFVKERLNILYEIWVRINSGSMQPNREHTTSKDSECMFCPFKAQCWDE